MQPPFLRPQLTEAQLAAKILDNGIQVDPHRVYSHLNKTITAFLLTSHTGYQLNNNVQIRFNYVCITFMLLLGGKRVFMYSVQLNSSLSFLQSKSSLEMMESQSCDAEPPPPPKPELRYPGITRGNTEGKPFALPVRTFPSEQLLKFFLPPPAECSLLKKAPPTPTMYKYRPSYSPGENHTVLTHAYANQVTHTSTLQT